MGLFFKGLKGENRNISALLLLVAFIVAFWTITDRLGSINTETSPQKTDFDFKVAQISFITEKWSSAEAKLKLPSLPKYSESWTGKPAVLVQYHVKTRGDEELSGEVMGELSKDYKSFVFSIQDDLNNDLGKVHTEKRFLDEYRRRFIREIDQLEIVVKHPETGEVLDTFTQKYSPGERRDEGWIV